MQNKNFILGLFYSDEKNRVFEEIKINKDLSEKRKLLIKSLSLRFIGPLFLIGAMDKDQKWKLNSIESTLTSYTEKISEPDIIQSFVCLNSPKIFEGTMTNLFTFIGSSYTEDIKLIHQKLIRYIHESIIQGKIVNESVLGGEFEYFGFINKELNRGIDLIEHSLGSARKIYWEEQQTYYCIGIIERKKSADLEITNLYTFDFDDPLKNKYLSFIPSYYVMIILPDYYETRIIETLRLFNIVNVYPNIRRISLNYQDKKILYLEEFFMDYDVKKSYGLILINDNKNHEDSNNLIFYKKKIRLILDKNKNFEETVIEINHNINPFEKWNTRSEETLKNIQKLLDNKN